MAEPGLQPRGTKRETASSIGCSGAALRYGLDGILRAAPLLGIPLGLLALAELAHVAAELLQRLRAVGRAQQVGAHVVELAGAHVFVEVALRQEIPEQRQRHGGNLDAGDVDVSGVDAPLGLVRCAADRPLGPLALALHLVQHLIQEKFKLTAQQ